MRTPSSDLTHGRRCSGIATKQTGRHGSARAWVEVTSRQFCDEPHPAEQAEGQSSHQVTGVCLASTGHPFPAEQVTSRAAPRAPNVWSSHDRKDRLPNAHPAIQPQNSHHR
jgi:hypothetical protein